MLARFGWKTGSEPIPQFFVQNAGLAFIPRPNPCSLLVQQARRRKIGYLADVPRLIVLNILHRGPAKIPAGLTNGPIKAGRIKWAKGLSGP
jgi:hypothetical protein